MELSDGNKKLSSSHIIFAAVIILITFGAYFNSLYGEFIWDDKDLILKHSGYLNDWKNIFSSFTEPFFGKAHIYRPILIISFIVDYQLWDSHPFGFHYTNVLFHTMNALMVYFLVCALLKHRYLALFSSLLFATHPIQTEAVAWISGRNDILLTFFFLLSLLFYIRWKKLTGTKRLLTFTGFVVAYGCVLLTKESGIIVFLIIILVDYAFQPVLPNRRNERRVAYLSIILISLLYMYLRMGILGTLGLGYDREDIIRDFFEPIVIYAYYFKMVWFPFNQTANPFIPYLTSVNNAVVISSSLVIFSLLVIGVLCWKYFREVSFSFLWIFIALLPVSGIIPLTVPALEHRLYLGIVGFSIFLPLLIHKILLLKTSGTSLSKMGSSVTVVFLVLVTSLYCIKTVVRNTVWKNEIHFWSKTAEESPFSVFAHVNLGNIYLEQKHYDRAIEEYVQALSLNPRASKTYSNLGVVYYAKGLYDKSLDCYEKALQLRPRSPKVYTDLGHFYYQVLKEYLSIDEGPQSKLNGELSTLARTYGVEGLYQKSFDYYRKALQLDTHNAEIHNNLGDLYYLRKLYQLAAKEYKLAIKYKPYYAEAFNNLGLVYFDENHYEDAQKEFLKALKVKPDFAEAHNNLALVYLNTEHYQEALKEFSYVLQMMPENAHLHYNLSLVYLGVFRDIPKGVYHLEKSLKINPDQPQALMIREMIIQGAFDMFAE